MGHVAERPAGPRIWIHAVSVGEAIVAETLVKALKKALPDVEIVVSTTTVTGQEVAVKRFGAENVFFYPHDFSWVVRRTLDRVKPSLIVLMELEVWPNLTAEAARRGIPVLVVNGRITERAARRYRKGWALVGPRFCGSDAGWRRPKNTPRACANSVLRRNGSNSPGTSNTTPWTHSRRTLPPARRCARRSVLRRPRRS